MARKPRENISDSCYHVVTRGNRKGNIFLSDTDRKLFLKQLSNIVHTFQITCHAFCLMSNHYHILLKTGPVANLSEAIHSLNGKYAKTFNKQHSLTGHVFERRFYSEIIKTEQHFLETVRYIALNPVRAQITNHPADWKWSSYRQTAGYESVFPFLNSEEIYQMLLTNYTDPRIAYRAFIQDGLRFDQKIESNQSGDPQHTYNIQQTHAFLKLRPI